jgi:hypothetical protein
MVLHRFLSCFFICILLAGCQEKPALDETDPLVQVAIRAQQTDPEAFGEHILSLETRCAQAKTKAQHDAIKAQVKMLLTVVGLHSPE